MRGQWQDNHTYTYRGWTRHYSDLRHDSHKSHRICVLQHSLRAGRRLPDGLRSYLLGLHHSFQFTGHQYRLRRLRVCLHCYTAEFCGPQLSRTSCLRVYCCIRHILIPWFFSQVPASAYKCMGGCVAITWYPTETTTTRLADPYSGYIYSTAYNTSGPCGTSKMMASGPRLQHSHVD